MTTDYKQILNDLCSKIGHFRSERPTAGTKFRLMGVVADIIEVTQTMQQEVLERVRHEAVLDVDTDIDYAETSQEVLAMELAECDGQDEAIREQTRLANEALGELHHVLEEIARQMERHHSDAEFERLYENEKRRYIGSGTYGRARKTFDEWKDNQCYGSPTLEETDDYRLEKVMLMFEKGVFRERVEHMQRAKRYPGELDFEQLDDDKAIKKTAPKHYAALRKMVDFQDGMLVVNPALVGRHFYASRHEENAKNNRTNFLKYMHKVDLVQQERRQLMEAEAASEANEEQLNYFAPTKHLKVLLSEEWFEIHRTDKCYDGQWTNAFVDALMASDHRDLIATDWVRNKRQDFIRGCVLGLLREGGVIKGSMDSIARSANVCENYRTLSKYMGQCRQEPYADWILNYIRKTEE